MRALIADDDRMTTEILSRTLKRWDFDVTTVADGAAAWEYLRAASAPILAILDWMMPNIEGAEVCRRVRKELPLANLYLILLTALERRSDVVAGLDAGADDYVIKPFDAEELRARVQVGVRVLKLQAELRAARDEFEQLASTDTLTGLCSRRRWFEQAAVEFSRSQRYHRPLGLLMADLDFFKQVNDTFGHETGDEVLKRFAEVLREQSRRSDVLGRVGGEEFAVLLPEAGIRAAQEVARRIVARCREVAIRAPAGEVTFSCSIGVTEVTPGDDAIEKSLQRADTALYQAKHSGRDRSAALPLDEPSGSLPAAAI